MFLLCKNPTRLKTNPASYPSSCKLTTYRIYYTICKTGKAKVQNYFKSGAEPKKPRIKSFARYRHFLFHLFDLNFLKNKQTIR